ncbi:regulatory protein RecX [Microbacterium sp.]|uniref:regulatory protein RecX n=1 Tax=Microbacterium sp. TaxID=51671 RepID=UPI003C76DF4B
MPSGNNDDGGDLAPVIPLFGDAPRAPRAQRVEAPQSPTGDHVPARSGASPTGDRVPARSAGVSRSRSHPEHDTANWHTTWAEEAADQAPSLPADEVDLAACAEQALLKKLRTRSLSEREARGALREHDLSDDTVETLVVGMRGHGYLDDARLAEQLIHTGTTRKGQGRQALAQTLAQRGIPRETIDAALAEFPDDDADRALEFARSKARAMAGLDREVALRRLAGQLARRGYGPTALSAARQALDEFVPARRSVHFE